VVTRHPVAYVPRPSRQVTVRVLALVVRAMRFTTVRCRGAAGPSSSTDEEEQPVLDPLPGARAGRKWWTAIARFVSSVSCRSSSFHRRRCQPAPAGGGGDQHLRGVRIQDRGAGHRGAPSRESMRPQSRPCRGRCPDSRSPCCASHAGPGRIAGVILMQVLPFADPKALAVYRDFERAVYRAAGPSQ
jgi:hypothetical protein